MQEKTSMLTTLKMFLLNLPKCVKIKYFMTHAENILKLIENGWSQNVTENVLRYVLRMIALN